uniref:Uncharacterized protein n=1 Tax=Leersia perrieri TaxID=77586 RepID=A0A0D9V298_9ORYZ
MYKPILQKSEGWLEPNEASLSFRRYTLGFVKKAVELQLLVCGERSWDIVNNSRHYYLSDHTDGLSMCATMGIRLFLANLRFYDGSLQYPPVTAT